MQVRGAAGVLAGDRDGGEGAVVEDHLPSGVGGAAVSNRRSIVTVSGKLLQGNHCRFASATVAVPGRLG